MTIKRRARIRKVGARGKRLEPILREMKKIVRRRSKGQCEASGCRFPAYDCHHTFGRGATGARLGDHWAHESALGVDLCRGDHNRVHIEHDAEFIDELKWAAICRLAAKHDLGPQVALKTADLNDFVRGMIRDIEARRNRDG